MKNHFLRQGQRPLYISPLLAVVMVTGCEDAPPTAPDVETVTWERYRDDQIGFALNHPDVYKHDPCDIPFLRGTQ